MEIIDNKDNFYTHSLPNRHYLPVFFLLCFSGNPALTSVHYSNEMLVIYTILFIIHLSLNYKLGNILTNIKSIIFVCCAIILLTLSQYYILGFVSLPGIISILIKILLGFLTLYYYSAKGINFMSIYIDLISKLVIISFPFWILNQFTFSGIPLENTLIKTYFFYTAFSPDIIGNNFLIRNPGMFWEPGAFAGYLLLALIFIIVLNQSYSLGIYKTRIMIIVIGVLTSLSSTGYILLGIIFLIHIWHNYSFGKYFFFPIALIFIYNFYISINFMEQKIEDQYSEAVELSNDDVSNTRFGSIFLDLQYIKEQPLVGNGSHVKTRYRLHPWITEDVGNGNGMSNFIVIWGVPLFLFWLYCLYKFIDIFIKNRYIIISLLLLIVLMLQGEQFLNYPVFLMFFSFKVITNLSEKMIPN